MTLFTFARDLLASWRAAFARDVSFRSPLSVAFRRRFNARNLVQRFIAACLMVLVASGADVFGFSDSLPSLFQPAWAQTATPQPSALEKLVIVTADGPKTFQVEVMRTMEERARGLMFRRYLPRDRGMLFDFAVEAPVAMWMKDTFIPLDMLFIRKDGTISQIADNTEPHSTRTIPSNEPVYSVLEINGGTASALGIKAGDKVVHPLFAKP